MHTHILHFEVMLGAVEEFAEVEEVALKKLLASEEVEALQAFEAAEPLVLDRIIVHT